MDPNQITDTGRAPLKNKPPEIASMSRKKILALPAGRWSDNDLLDIETTDDDREAALIELVLRSPELNELIDYSELYFDLVNYYQRRKDTGSQLYWAIALFAFEAQNGLVSNRSGNYRNIAEMLTTAGDLEAGLGLFARLLLADPGNTDYYNGMGFALPEVGLNALLVEVMDRALEVTSLHDPDDYHDQFAEFYAEALDKAPGDGEWTDKITPSTLALLRKSLNVPLPEKWDDEIELPYLLPVEVLAQPQIEEESTIYESILADGRLWVPDLVRVVFDEELFETPAPHRALDLLRKLRTDHPDLGALANIIDRDLGDSWQRRLLSKRIGKIGGYPDAELVAFAG